MYWATGEFPTSGLILVECANGKWFVEIDHGHDYDDVAGVSKPRIEPYVTPEFFDNQEMAKDFAISVLKSKYSVLSSCRNLNDWFVDRQD